MIITVASGKGGTGKTTFSVNLAYALARHGEAVRLLDCDVEEPNDHLFVRPVFAGEHPVEVLRPVWDKERCTGCGRCAEVCRYNAVAVLKGTVLVFSELCHACGACSHLCPSQALTETPSVIGLVRSGETGSGEFAFTHGELSIGESLAPTVVDAVKQLIDPAAINILDAPPGTACPVVRSLDGTDVAVLVTEPTPFGLHDLKLATAMTLGLGIPTGIMVNRSDGKDDLIRAWSEETGVPIIGRIPFSRAYAETYAAGDILVDRHPDLTANLMEIHARILALAGEMPPPKTIPEPFSPDGGEHPLTPLSTASDYREVTVISGKGGTGKTTVTASFAELSKAQVLADNDVDAADLHLLLTPTVREVHPFIGGIRARVDPALCIGCGACAEACRFGAFRPDDTAGDRPKPIWRVDPLACEGCGLCEHVCPVQAIRIEDAVTGQWLVSDTTYGPMVHARLGIAEENSGRLVSQVRFRAAELASRLGAERILADGPPGTGCPVIASVTGSDLVLIVTEPTVSGVHDMERVLALTAHFKVPALILINKADLNAGQAERIEKIAAQKQARVIARIPFDRTVNEALMAGQTVISYGDSPAGKAIQAAWQEIQSVLANLA